MMPLLNPVSRSGNLSPSRHVTIPMENSHHQGPPGQSAVELGAWGTVTREELDPAWPPRKHLIRNQPNWIGSVVFRFRGEHRT